MKARSDSVPAWPFALAAVAITLLLLAGTWTTQPRTYIAFPQPVWGEPVGQLQLAAVLDSDTGFVGVWLRSVATNEVFVHGWGLGYIESIEPEMRVGDQWVRLFHSPSWGWGYTGIGPRTKDIYKLSPREELFRHSPVVEQIKVLHGQSIMAGGSGRVALGEIRRWQEIERAFGSPTFMLSLAWFEWPKSITQQSRVTIRAKQKLALPVGVRVRAKNPDGTTSYEPGERQWTDPPPPYVAAGSRWVNVYSQPIEFAPAKLAAVLNAKPLHLKASAASKEVVR
jgi:hypothetical protein